MLRVALLILILALALPATAQEARPPNIVLLLGDDHGYPYFGFTGSDHVHTPNMDLLARDGATFLLGHVTDNHCRPSLATLMTGLFPAQYEHLVDEFREAAKAQDPDYLAATPDEQRIWENNFGFIAMNYFTTLPQLLDEQGYASFQGGKWWEQSYKNGGFSHGMSTGWDLDAPKGPGWFHEFMGGKGMELTRETMEPVYDFIDVHADQPFYIWYGPSLPHTPLNPPYKYLKYYQNTDLSESAKLYYGNCTWWDAGVGDLVNYIESKGLLENTIFVYVNDNGWEQPPFVDYTPVRDLFLNGGTKGKLGLHDLTFRTPVIVHWAGQIEPQLFEDELVSTTDIVPTLLDYAGVDIPNGLPGQSLRPLIEGREFDSRQALIGRITQTRSDDDPMGQRTRGYYYRDQRWHFMWWRDLGREELYDMVADPEAEQDVAAEHAALITRFKGAIEAWETEIMAEVSQ
ncbi:MAG: sulfatase-like hydrolase/transferase [Rhodothermales bacterium]|nr:sulfatase-like hydrolase/transferase [Rhodothermales bacterium]MBO6778080.1 sulfatase-like hydrolase/transferase [Rhodothermales bacterium]